MIIDLYKLLGNLKTKREKGKLIREWIDSYVVIDIETTGLTPLYDEIIEFAAIKIKNNSIIDSYSTLVKPSQPISSFITSLTGITNEMLENAPKLENIMNNIISFIADSTIIGHNVSFDINFLYDNLFELSAKKLTNNYMDTLYLARKIIPNMDNHRLSTLKEYFNISTENSHRAYDDAYACYITYESLRKLAKENNISISKSNYNSKKLSSKDIVPSIDNYDENNIFFGKNICFTGTLKITRKEAMQIIANLGGIPVDGVNKKTDFLVVGLQDYAKVRDGKSNKQLKAEELILKGHNIQILSENVFYDMVDI